MKKTYLLALSLVCGLGGNGLAQEAAKPLKAYIVSDAHFDTQWNWDVQTSINEYVKNTLERNLSLLERYPDYLFNFEGAIKYAWMKEYYPDMYEKMKNYIREGRWNVCGSSWDANDVLILSSESVIRNILLGQTFLSRGVRHGKYGHLPARLFRLRMDVAFARRTLRTDRFLLAETGMAQPSVLRQ